MIMVIAPHRDVKAAATAPVRVAPRAPMTHRAEGETAPARGVTADQG